MKNFFLIFIAMGILLSYGGIVPATLYQREGNDMVTYTETARQKDVFDPSVKADELDSEKAMSLIAGETKELPLVNETTIIKEVLFWHFPVKTSSETVDRRFALINGKISKIEIPVSKNINGDWLIEIFWRTLPTFCIILFILTRASKPSLVLLVLSGISSILISFALLKMSSWSRCAMTEWLVLMGIVTITSSIIRNEWRKNNRKVTMRN